MLKQYVQLQSLRPPVTAVPIFLIIYISLTSTILAGVRIFLAEYEYAVEYCPVSLHCLQAIPLTPLKKTYFATCCVGLASKDSWVRARKDS